MPKKNEIQTNSIVADVITDNPELESVFVDFGFKNILNPVMRRTVAKKMTIEMGCRMKDVDIDKFLDALNAAVTGE